jgi:hypothetical protein
MAILNSSGTRRFRIDTLSGGGWTLFDFGASSGTAWNSTGGITQLNGNLGIGATSPGQFLDIGGSASNMTFSSSAGPHQILTGGSSNLALMPGGNVGIGTTSPTAELAVSSTATSTLQLGTGQSTTKGSCVQMYAPNGTAYRLYVANAGTLTTEAGACK